jgi:hypothetical protein
MRQVDADLVGPARLQLRLEQAHSRPARQQPEDRVRRLALLRVHSNATLAIRRQVLVQGQPDVLRRVHPAPADQHQVTLVGTGAMLAEHVVQRCQRQPLLADQQDAGRLAIEAVCQFEKLRLRPLPAQGLDDAEADPAAAMHRDTVRLVDHKHGIVLVDHRQFDALFGDIVDGTFRALGYPHRRQAQPIAGAQPVGRGDPPAVDPYLAAAQDAVEMALRHPLAVPDQEIVQALAMLGLADHDVGDRIATGAVHFPIY